MAARPSLSGMDDHVTLPKALEDRIPEGQRAAPPVVSALCGV